MTSQHNNEPALKDRRRAEIRGVITMSIPVVITTSSRALMDVADYVMITWLGVDEAQAAILPAQLIMWSYIVLGLGVVSIVNTFAAQCLGRKLYRKCSMYAWQVIYLAAMFGLAGASLWPLVPGLIKWIGHAPGVQALEGAYLQVALLTIGPTIAAGGLGWFFIGIHRPQITMRSVLEANVVNVIVSYVLIFGHLGFAPMGIAGAAWGTLAGVTYRMIRLTLTLIGSSMEGRYHSCSSWKPSWAGLADLLRIGLPCGFEWLCEVVVWAIFINVLIGAKFGTAHLVATNTAWQYMRIAFMPTIGVGQALTALVGKAIGEEYPSRAIRETGIVIAITLAYMGSLSMAYWLFGGELVGLFNSDPGVMEIGGQVMICAAVFQLFDALGITYHAALRGAGDTFIPSLFFIVSNWVIIVGGGWLMVTLFPGLGSLGAWLASSTLIVVTGVFLWWRWHSRVWMRINLFSEASAPKESVAGDNNGT